MYGGDGGGLVPYFLKIFSPLSGALTPDFGCLEKRHGSVGFYGSRGLLGMNFFGDPLIMWMVFSLSSPLYLCKSVVYYYVMFFSLLSFVFIALVYPFIYVSIFSIFCNFFSLSFSSSLLRKFFFIYFISHF